MSTTMRCALSMAILLQSIGAVAAAAGAPDTYPVWREAAARALATRHDADSLATAAALTFLGSPSRPKSESAKAAAAALDLAIAASDLAPDNAAISWLRIQLCTNTPGCDVRIAATTLRWVAADNSAAWLPTLATAQKDKDSTEVDRVLASMSEGTHFDLYTNRAAVMMDDALRNAHAHLPAKYLPTALSRLTEAMEIADAALLPSFSPLINACRESTPGSPRREDCLELSRTMQRGDAVMTQLVGFAIAKRLVPADSKELRTIAERRRVLEWRVAAADQSDEPLTPSFRNEIAQSRLAKMRTLPREEDVCIALLRQYHVRLEPPEDRR